MAADPQPGRRTGGPRDRQHTPPADVANELGDHIADVLFIGSLAFVAAVGPGLALSAVIAALLASFVGITVRAAGAPRQYGGVMSKPGRMIVLAVAGPLALLLGAAAPLVIAAWVILAGALVTLVQRLLATRQAIAPGDGGDTP